MMTCRLIAKKTLSVLCLKVVSNTKRQRSKELTQGNKRQQGVFNNQRVARSQRDLTRGNRVADRLTEERSGAPYFAATVIIDKAELTKLEGRKLLPVMSSEAMIGTGSRTVLAYLVEPITQNFRRALREK
nr:hypothetical protein [Rhizobium leguminosarum]